MVVCHRCDTPACCEPNHLFLGTQIDNISDMMMKGRRGDHRGVLNGRAKLTPELALEIRSRRGEATQRALAKEYGISETAISYVMNNQRWT